jgi:SAM-dependent methyltransferase
MFGQSIDYWLLRPLVHCNNRASEEELDVRARETKPFDAVKARRRLEKLMVRFEGNLRIDPNTSYVDVGCGHGDLALALTQAGATDVTGVDIVERHVAEAAVTTQRVEVGYRPTFVCADINTWRTDKLFDVVISNEALEHIAQPDEFIRSLGRILKPGGVAFLAFGPLFHSPVGDHLNEFFRVELPWRGVLFSEKALLRLRQEFFRPGDPIDRFQDMVGGLNLMRFSEFLRYVSEAGLDLDFLSVNPQLKSIPPLHWISEILRRIPVVRDYFVTSVYAVLKRSRSTVKFARPVGSDSSK